MNLMATGEVEIMRSDSEHKLARLAEKWNERVTRAASAEQHINELAEAAAEVGLQSYVGWILHAGRVYDQTFQVQFNIPGNGYSSRWPEWAYEPARDSLLHKRRVWVISDGLPFGQNLLQVLILQQDL